MGARGAKKKFGFASNQVSSLKRARRLSPCNDRASLFTNCAVSMSPPDWAIIAIVQWSGTRLDGARKNGADTGLVYVAIPVGGLRNNCACYGR